MGDIRNNVIEIGTAIIIFLIALSPFYLNAVILFIIHYLAFIAIYEIGYFLNDTISIQHEKIPNKRLTVNYSNLFSIIFILVRLFFFISITYYLSYQSYYIWYIFYIFLLVVFVLHNYFKNPNYKLATFQMLAFLRCIAPFFAIIDYYYIFLIGNLVALTYVPYRSLGYMKKKALSVDSIRRDYVFRILIFIIPVLFFTMLILIKL